MNAPTYTGKGGYVWKEPVETKHPDGTTSFTLGFRVCKVMPEVGDEAATTLAMMLNIAERAEAEVAIRAELVAALHGFVSHYPHGINSMLDDACNAARDAIAKATGATP